MEQSNLQLASDLRSAVTLLFKKLRKKSATGQGLSLTERSTLGLLSVHKQLLPNELAAMEHITTQSMSQVLNYLLELGYITRTMSQEDKRKAIIALSPEGEAMIEKMRSERDEWLNKAIRESCTPEEQEALIKLIKPLTKLIDFD
ncbi:MarR family transcriptional regulator [Mucilaginibacter sp. HMF5004]|uniref:MarR family winged helix-turn-helix transcriptional regulator n=1 Tax=Mucilaginibacter rivuli TaxID=2857527 RepID=UPI001C5D4F4F|nr:MarR family transcriptional regulator [Mucilaginibacter rivuli]MBW4890380.1 MarR family transcriptional regulator [Mucilaginibacter rivuli]